MGKTITTRAFLFLLTIGLLSCQSKEEQLIGHWHEYEVGNPDYISCHKITDSTYNLTIFNYISDITFKRGIDIQKNEIIDSHKNGVFGYDVNDYLSIDFSIEDNKLIVNDSIYWIRQEDNEQTFISDFSAGLLVNIHPFETKVNKFDYKNKKENYNVYIYVGKLKKSILKSSNEYSSKHYYIQLNDRIADLNAIRPFLINESYSENEGMSGKIILNADKDTPKSFLDQIETEILNCGYKRNQIFYLTMNPKKRTYGYNKRE